MSIGVGVVQLLAVCSRSPQLWMPGPDTEALLYLSDPSHGLALCDTPSLLTARQPEEHWRGNAPETGTTRAFPLFA